MELAPRSAPLAQSTISGDIETRRRLELALDPSRRYARCRSNRGAGECSCTSRGVAVAAAIAKLG